ncbi:universal stress protein [Solirubrobacter ginsenosidimutans]|uniref:Universal stress protein n=1 Tax=Solirubrobacter ginsenosidimutans TaxID=490573 RepID=A0A9X3MUU7_9ACTN|nr:universal stress protein [Solirubrobacter ginsenosidimutans]MDA0161707.1 universal stress protein [Solirubrobacter ginsenosidimutans]
MTESPRPVLVGIDGTASGLEALALAEAFAVLAGSPLLLAAVCGHQSGAFSDVIWPPKRDAAAWLQEASRRLGDLVPWTCETMMSNSPAHGLVELAGLEEAQMIVLGSNRHGPLGRLLSGSTARAVAHGAPCAVAVAPHDWRPQPPDVPLTFGVGVSDSDESRDALALAASLADWARAPLKLVTAVHVAAPLHPMYAEAEASRERWRHDQLDAGHRVAREAVAAVAPAVTPEIVVVEGDPVECLERASHDLDVLVIGSRRFGPFRRALLGGVSSPLIDRAACPVVIVPRGAHAESKRGVAGDAVAHA